MNNVTLICLWYINSDISFNNNNLYNLFYPRYELLVKLIKTRWVKADLPEPQENLDLKVPSCESLTRLIVTAVMQSHRSVNMIGPDKEVEAYWLSSFQCVGVTVLTLAAHVATKQKWGKVQRCQCWLSQPVSVLSCWLNKTLNHH